jgi:hypothetical protein
MFDRKLVLEGFLSLSDAFSFSEASDRYTDHIGFIDL